MSCKIPLSFFKISKSEPTTLETKPNATERLTQLATQEKIQQKREEEKVQCDECGKFIAIHQREEHSDYHYARKLQREEKSEPKMESPPKKNQNSTI